MENYINICIIGNVSVGKTTFINAILSDEFSVSSKKRSTMVPQVYIEKNNIETFDIQKIKDINDSKNNEILNKLNDLEKSNEKLDSNDIQIIKHDIHRLKGISDNLDNDIFLAIYDLPGICDAISKDALMTWLNNNFKIFDIIIFITQIDGGLNTMEEKELMYTIIDLIKNEQKKGKYIELIPIINKCDNIIDQNGKQSFSGISFDNIIGDFIEKKENSKKTIDIESDILIDDDEKENQEIYYQINDLFKNTIIKKEIKNTQKNFIPISAEWAFLIRSLESYDVEQMKTIDWYNSSGKTIIAKYGKFYSNKRDWSKTTINNQIKKVIEFKMNMNVNTELNNTGFLLLFNQIKKLIDLNLSKFVSNVFINNDLSINDFDEYCIKIEKLFYQSCLFDLKFNNKVSSTSFFNLIKGPLHEYFQKEMIKYGIYMNDEKTITLGEYKGINDENDVFNCETGIRDIEIENEIRNKLFIDNINSCYKLLRKMYKITDILGSFNLDEKINDIKMKMITRLQEALYMFNLDMTGIHNLENIKWIIKTASDIGVTNPTTLIENFLKNILHINEKNNREIFFTGEYKEILKYLSNISEKNDNFITILNCMDYPQEKARMIIINNENKLKKHNKGIMFYYKLLRISINENKEDDIIKGYDYNNVDITMENEIINKHCI